VPPAPPGELWVGVLGMRPTPIPGPRLPPRPAVAQCENAAGQAVSVYVRKPSGRRLPAAASLGWHPSVRLYAAGADARRRQGAGAPREGASRAKP
jgi:hypothetical protein